VKGEAHRVQKKREVHKKGKNGLSSVNVSNLVEDGAKKMHKVIRRLV
jgi:hypothetical protein